MSKQQSFMPDERQVSKSGRKRKGKYELWMRRKPERKNPSFWFTDWHRVRKYETLELAEKNRDDHKRELAEKNRDDHKRKWSDDWEFEVRINN